MPDAFPRGAAGPRVGSWLCGDALERERMLDMERRVGPARRRMLLILAAVIALLSPWVGSWPLLVVVPTGAAFALSDSLTGRSQRPELMMFATWCAGEVALAVAVALQTPGHLATLSWLALPVLTLTSRFPTRGVVAGTCVTIALAIGAAFAADAGEVLRSPDLLAAPLTLIASVAMLSLPLMRSDIEHRTDAVIDQLTGMLNRKALDARVHELTVQSRASGEPIGVIVADLDHFKEINDTRGHGAGDAALRDASLLLRRQLRAFDLAYRLGGEEFVILVPGADIEQTVALAERVRAGVAAQRIAGDVSVTLSLGVSAAAPGQSFDYQALFAEADGALYRAKSEGRNRVCVAAAAASRARPAGLSVVSA